jgi:dTDP-glucose 4,6-dehydratase
MKLVVITGCLGFIGSHIVNKCLGMGWKVYGIDSETYASNPSLIKTFKAHYKNNFTFINEDISDLKHLPDCDYVINIAADQYFFILALMKSTETLKRVSIQKKT